MRFAIVITSIFMFSVSFGQHSLSGLIEDTQTGKGLNAVKVHLSGSNKAVITKKTGKFEIEVVNAKDTIFFSKEGYYTEWTVVETAKRLKIGLTQKAKPEMGSIDSYGGLSQRQNTSSIVVIETEDFNKGAVTDIYQLLRGKVPGLVIKHDPSNPTGRPFIMLRGSASFSNVIEPLIVVDGVPNVSLDTVDPNDVSSVSVLKDGSAQAMYGSQATGGAILIRTKKK